MANIRTNVQRSNVNETNVQFTDHPKSGYSLSYSSQLSGKIGKLLPVAFQYIMPNDKVSGDNSIDIQFEPTSVPMIAPLQVHMHNFYVPFRDVVGSDFEEFMSPENGYSPDVSTLPMFSLKEVFEFILVSSNLPVKFPSVFEEVNSWLSEIQSLFIPWFRNLCSSSLLNDFYDEWLSHLDTFGSPNSENWQDWVSNYFIALIQPLFGEGSYLDMFGYPILNNDRIRYFVDNQLNLNDAFPSLLLSELPLRCLWAIWFDRYRNVNVERKRIFYNIGLNYKKWTAAPLTPAVLLHLLLPRYRNWSRDMFTSSLVDDPSRHVYATLNGVESDFEFDNNASDFIPAQDGSYADRTSHGIVSYRLSYQDESGTQRYVTLPIPSSIIAPLSSDITSSDSYGRLDLLTLRRAKMFENYLKRNYYFGDEYQDRMAAHYGSRVSDSRVNRPEYLSGNTSQVNVQQTVSNINNDDTDAGQRTAYLDAQQDGGDRFDFYCEEFGMIISIMSVTPDAFYDPMPAQLLSSKLMDFPFPEFANQNEELSKRMFITRNFGSSELALVSRPFGHHPQYVSWRGRVNELHGNALSTRRWYTFSRVWNNRDNNSTPLLNPYFIHCRPSLDMFISNDPLNDVWFGYLKHNFFVERVLPQVTEVL